MLNKLLTLALAAISTEAMKLNDFFAQVDHPIAGGEGTGTPQEELQELSVELVADDELAQIEAYSQFGMEGERCTNEGQACGD